MRVIIAARLSRKGKGQTGIDTQDLDSRDWAEDNGHEVIATIPDRKSGTLAPFERPNLKPWVTQDDHMALYDGIVVAKHDRLSREDWSDEARIRLWAEENNKKLIIVDLDIQWPPRNADDRQRWNNAQEQSRREWEATSRRYRRMQRALREQKFFVGKRSFGYRIIGVTCKQSPCLCDEDHKLLEIDEAEAVTVREIYRRYLDGESLVQIRNWITASGIPAMQGENWSSQAIRRILRNPVYTGRVLVHGQTYLTVPAIIGPDDFERVQEKLASKATRGPVSKSPAMLTGILRCEDGHKMYRLKGRPIPTVPDGLYYYCNPEEAPKGQRLLVPMQYADNTVNAEVMRYRHFPHAVKKMSSGLKYQDDIARLKQDIRELDPLADDFMDRVGTMRSEIKGLEVLASKEAGTRWVPDGKKVGEVWQALDSADKLTWLKEREWAVTVSRDEDMRSVDLPPYRIAVETGDYFDNVDALVGVPKGTFVKDNLRSSTEDYAQGETEIYLSTEDYGQGEPEITSLAPES